MLTYRRPVLVLQLLLAAASTTSPATFIEGGCYRDAVQSPWVSMSGGHYSPEGLTPDICKNFCGRLHFWYCAADEGRYCYCLQKLGTLVAASGLCTAVCVDGSECGGSTPGLLTLWQTSVLTGHLNLTLNANTSLFPVGATVSVTVNATSSWVTNWGDGSIYITNGTNHTYTIPGEYTVVAFLELVPGVMDGATVTVVSKPNGTLNCPAHVTVGEAAVCPLITSTQGYGSVLNTTYTEPGMPQTSYHIPEEVSRVYGSILNVAAPAGNPRLLKTPTALTLHSEGVHAGYLATVRVMATTPGWLSLYALSGGCASGAYCSESGECNTGCSPHYFNQTCSTFLCLPAGKCNGPACTTGSAPEASSYQYRFLYSFYVSVLNIVYTSVLDSTTVEVFDGEILAVGCLQAVDCSSAPPTISTRPMHPTEVQDIIVSYVDATTATVTGNITDKLLVSVSVREHEVVNMSYLVNCSTASSVPTALVPSPYTLNTSRYSLMGTYNLSYVLVSEFLGSSSAWTGQASVLCQQVIDDPVLVEEVWVPLLLTTPFTISFIKGAPLFSSLDWGLGVKYTYYANATNVDWVLQLNYTKTGNFTLIGNASNAISWANYSSVVHVVPVVSDRWTATALCPCLSATEGFTITINLTAATNPPFSAQIYATYDNVMLFPNQTLDFGTSGGGGVAQALQKTFHTTILQPGNHLLTFFLYNQVSNTTFNTTVSVAEGLANVSFTTKFNLEGVMTPGLGAFNTTFMFNTTIVFTPACLKGFPSVDRWRLTLYPSGQVLDTTVNRNGTLSYVFNTSGNYSSVVSGYNTVQGWVMSDPVVLIIVPDLTGFVLGDDGRIIEPNVTKIVNANFTVLPPLACLLVDFGDNTPDVTFGFQHLCVSSYPTVAYGGPSSNPMNIPHVYTQEGIYQVRGLAWDYRVSYSSQLQVVIAILPCNMPNVQIVEKYALFSEPQINQKSMPLVKATLSQIQCNRTVPVSRWWEVLKVSESTGQPERDIPIQSALLSWNYSQLEVTPLFLDLGLYKLSYWVRLDASKVFSLQRADFTYVKIIPTPLRAVLMTGSAFSLSRGYGQTLSLNPQELSVDPDNPGDTNFTVTWWCRQVDPVQETHLTDSSGNIEVYNLHPVPAPLAAQNLTGGGCFGKGPGTLQYSGGSMTLVTSSFVKHSVTYEIFVRIAKDTRQANTFLQVEVTMFPPPNVQIKCVDEKLCWPYDGGLLVNPSSRLALVGSCVSACSTNMALQWTITDMGGNSVVQTDTVNLGQVFLTSLTGTNIAANPLFFDLNPNIDRFRFRLTMETETFTSGFAEVIMVPNGPPKSGACVLNTNSLRALLDSTVASCNNWKDPEGIGIDSYTFYYPHSTTEITLASSGFNTVNLIFPVGIFDVWCRIADKFGSFTNVYVGKVNASMITKEEFQSYNPSSVLRNLAAIGDQTTMAMVLISLASIKDHADWLSLSDSSFSNMSASEINDRLTQVSNMNKESLDFAADTMDFASLSQLSVGAGVLKSSACGVLTQEKAAFTVDMDFREKSLNFMNKMMGKLNVTPIYSPYDIQPFASSFLDAAVCILKSMNEVIENPTLSPPGDLAKASSLDYETGIDQTKIGFVIPLDPVTQMKQNVLEITRQRAKGMVQKMFQLVDSLGSVILGKCVVGENINEQGDSGGGMLVTKISEDTLADGVEIRPQNSLNASVAFPGSFCPSRYSQNYSDCTNVVGFTAVVWPCLTHVYPESMTYLSKETTVITLSVFVEDENVTVDNETQPITLVIPRRPESLPDPVSVVGNTDINDLVPFVYHSFNVSSADSAFTVEIHPDGNTPPKLVILIDYKRLPTPSQYDTISYVKNFTLNENGTYSWFVNNIDNKNRTGNFYVAVAILKDNVTLPDPRSNATLQKENFSVDFNFNYTFRVITSGCYFYNSTIDVWSGIGMTVVDANSTHTSCHTLHLTSFGSGYSPSPNAIDFDYIFAAAGFVNNLIIYLVIIITLVCYVIMMIWARFMDKRDVQYRGVTALEDNKVEDKYLYEVTFTTGPDKEAGTDSNIQFIVSGEYDETGVRALPPSDNRRYHRYSVDVFVMSTHGPLGNIDTLRIWHDNTGRSPFDSWQLQTVVIRDLQTRDKFIFHANTWLALDHDDKKIDVLLEPSDGETNEEFITGFYNKGNRGANEDHMWISIFLRPTGSRYSRKERVSVATLYLYLSMLINAACYHILSDTPRTGVFEYSSFTLSIQQVIIGLASGIMAYPVIFLLVFIFKRSRPRKLKKCRSLEAAAKQRRNQHIESGTDTEKDDLLTDYDLTTHQTRSNRSKDSSPVRCIPWWTRWLAWLLILAGIGVCAFFVWSYGIMWGEIKSVKWFSSFIISFFISVLVTQWLKVLLTTTIGVVCCKAQNTMTEDIDCDEELPELRYDEEWKNVQPMDPSVKRKVHVMGGVDSSEAEVAAIATRLTEKREMNVVLRDVGSYCIFLLVLFVLVNGQTNYNAFLLQAQMTNTFIKIGNPQFDFSSKVL